MTILTFVWLRWLGGGATIAPASAGQPGLGRGRPRAQDCQEDGAARPGLRGQRERERERAAVSATSTVSQCGVASSHTECHDQQRHSVTRPVTVTLPSHTEQPLSRMSQ